MEVTMIKTSNTETTRELTEAELEAVMGGRGFIPFSDLIKSGGKGG
jgi:hypothetical protein